VELPTYTNIWKIEKRLYKLYDFRLPMPLPVGQVTVFLAIAVPYMVILTLVGMPFSHTWVWLYALPPGVLAWLVTRPVLEGKRLPELALSQIRYLAEPRTWCRMTPVAEKDRVIVVAQVWRAPAVLRPVSLPAAAEPAVAPGAQDRPAWPDRPAVSRPGQRREAAVEADIPARWPAAATPPGVTVGPRHVGRIAAAMVPATAVGPAGSAASAAAAPQSATAAPVPMIAAPGPPANAAMSAPEGAADGVNSRTRVTARGVIGAVQPTARRSPPTGPAGVTVHASPAGDRPLHVVERALRTTPGGAGWGDRVVVVPGGHRPGKPDHVQRDQGRARLALPGPVRIVVLGSTAGAGQTVTALLTGQLLASLRAEAVAVLDLCAGPGSVTELAREIPRLLPDRQPTTRTDPPAGAARDRALHVVTAEHAGSGPRDADRLIDAVCNRYPLTIADPPARDVPRALQAADQLVLVSPAGADAAGSLAMTLEWLEAHGHERLVQASVTVLNGVSAQTAAHAERAAGVAIGRCRAVVRVPWDARLSDGGALGGETVRAFTALAGVLISGLAASGSGDAPIADAPSPGPAPAGRESR
jgi:TcpE family